MKNTVEIPNHKGQALKLGYFFSGLIGLLFAFCLAIFVCVHTINLNGDVSIYDVTVKEINSSNSELVTIKHGKFNLNPVKDRTEWESYVGKDVTIIAPAKQFSGTTWVIGLVDNGNIVIDYNEVIAERRAGNLGALIAFAVISGGLLIASAILYVLYRKSKKTEEISVDDFVWRTSANSQPMTPQRKLFAVWVILFVLIIIIPIVILGSLSEKNESNVLNITLAVLAPTLIVLGCVLLILSALKFLPKSEIKYYAKNYPFNFDDISHMQYNRALKAQMQQQLKAERLQNPDRFYDGGNGFNAVFTNEGLNLREEDFEADFERETLGVFEEFDDTAVANRPYETTISYDELNFIAIPKYRKYDHVFGIVIKSRLDETKIDIEKIQYDVHFLLDTNLLNSIRKFNVKVQDLDYLLENVEKLMKENCPKSKDNFPMNNML